MEMAGMNKRLGIAVEWEEEAGEVVTMAAHSLSPQLERADAESMTKHAIPEMRCLFLIAEFDWGSVPIYHFHTMTSDKIYVVMLMLVGRI